MTMTGSKALSRSPPAVGFFDVTRGLADEVFGESITGAGGGGATGAGAGRAMDAAVSDTAASCFFSTVQAVKTIAAAPAATRIDLIIA